MITPNLKITIGPEQMPEDSQEVLRIQNAYDSEPTQMDDFIRVTESWPASDPRKRFVAKNESGKIVGFAHCRRRASMKPGLFFLNLCVDRSEVGQGVGTRLLDVAETFAIDNGADQLTAFVNEDDSRGRPFADTNDYIFTRHIFESLLEVDQHSDEMIDRIVEDTATRAGVRFTTMAEFGKTKELEDRLYAQVSECDLDEPASLDFGILSREDYQRLVLDASWFTPEGTILAVAEDKWVGSHVLGPAGEGSLADFSVDFTGVLKSHRRLGVAYALKLLGVKHARAHGGKTLMTHNDSTNEAMLAVNKKLGYTPRPGMLFMTKTFTGQGAPKL